MGKTVALLVVGVLVAVGSVVDWGSRAEVAEERVIAKIDSLLGTMAVKRKEIEHGVTTLDDGIRGLRKAKIKAQVQADQLQRKSDLLKRSIGAIDTTLKTLKDHLRTGSSVSIAGREYLPARLDQMARRVLQRRRVHVQQMDELEIAGARLGKVTSTLHRQQTEYEDRLAGIKSQLTLVDANQKALKAMQDAARAMDGGEASLAKNVACLEDKVNELYADVESELAGEDSKWNETAARQELQSVEAIVMALNTPQNTVNEIDMVLDNPATYLSSD